MNSIASPDTWIRLYRTGGHPCSYKPEREATTVFVDPTIPVDRMLNSRLTDLGFRRSGAYLYRPDCEGCSACISCRIPVQQFRPRRRHRRILRCNRDISMSQCRDPAEPAMFSLYQNYIDSRHPWGDMYPANAAQYETFIKSRTPHTRFYAFHQGSRLKAACVVDKLQRGLSAVYTFYDPTEPRRSLGNYVILRQVELARQLGLDYLYLGYWVENCPKMHYKAEFRPLQLLVGGRWLTLG